MNGMQPLCDGLPCVLAPKTIDNDLGLNFSGEPELWERIADEGQEPNYEFNFSRGRPDLQLDQIVNYVTPGYATSVFVTAGGIHRVRTTAESHRRIAIVEVMGRHSGYIALGTAYGQPDLILIPEVPLDLERLVDRVKEIYERQHNVVIVCGEGIVDRDGRLLGDTHQTSDPSGNVILSGAAVALKKLLVDQIGDAYFQDTARKDSARRSIFTRKVGHTQRGGRPLRFDRHLAAQQGAKAVEMLLAGKNNHFASVTWQSEGGFRIEDVPSNRLRDRWGHIHARQVHPSFYNCDRMYLSTQGAEYLLPIFSDAIGPEDLEYERQSLFDSGNLLRPYHSINVDIQRRIEFIS